MQRLLLKLGCLLIGYNYGIIRNASEVSAKSVRKYTSAVFIISILWGFIGYSFAARYLKLDAWGASLVSMALIFIVIQIERQIILTVGRNIPAMIFRCFIAIAMALLGALIMDQILFKEDIERHKISSIQSEVNRILPEKTTQLDQEIEGLNSQLAEKEQERLALINEITRNPFIKGTTREAKNHAVRVTDEAGGYRDTIERRWDVTIQDIQNPKAALIGTVNSQIETLHKVLNERQAYRLTMRSEIEADLKSKTGLLDELEIVKDLITSSWVALGVWLLLFLFFVSIELFVLAIKWGDQNSEYEKIILQQMNVNLARLQDMGDSKSTSTT